MTANMTVGAFEKPPSQSLSGIEVEVVPIDLVTEWRRCGMIADFVADYMAYGFERRATARSVLSTLVNELVENAVKFSADKRAPAQVSIQHHGEVVVAEVRNQATKERVEDLRQILADLASADAAAVFRRRLEERRGLGLAMLARDYRVKLGATMEPAGTGGITTVCLRVAVSASEVEQR